MCILDNYYLYIYQKYHLIVYFIKTTFSNTKKEKLKHGVCKHRATKGKNQKSVNIILLADPLRFAGDRFNNLEYIYKFCRILHPD